MVKMSRGSRYQSCRSHGFFFSSFPRAGPQEIDYVSAMTLLSRATSSRYFVPIFRTRAIRRDVGWISPIGRNLTFQRRLILARPTRAPPFAANWIHPLSFRALAPLFISINRQLIKSSSFRSASTTRSEEEPRERANSLSVWTLGREFVSCKERRADLAAPPPPLEISERGWSKRSLPRPGGKPISPDACGRGNSAGWGCWERGREGRKVCKSGVRDVSNSLE